MIPSLPKWYDEPFADPSQIPTLLVSRLTRQHVTVALSGDGGDELFAGYPRYFWNARLRRGLNRVPTSMRRWAGIGLRALSAELRETLAEHLPARVRRLVTHSRLEKLSGVLGESDPTALYRQILSLWSNPNQLVLGDREAKGRLWEPGITPRPPFRT